MQPDLGEGEENVLCIVRSGVDKQVQVVSGAVWAVPRHSNAANNEEADTCRREAADERLVAAEVQQAVAVAMSHGWKT